MTISHSVNLLVKMLKTVNFGLVFKHQLIKRIIKKNTTEIQYDTCGSFTQYNHFDSIIEFSFGGRIITELRPG